MTSARRWQVGCLLTALLIAPVTAARAEVSADTPAAVNVLILGVIEGPDPIGQAMWQPVRDVSSVLFLNPDGALRADGPPAVDFHTESGWPHVVWAYDAGGSFEVAYARWMGTAWTPADMLTSSAEDELDPRIHMAKGGSTYVVWWEQAAQRVWLSSRVQDGSWLDPEMVTDILETGRRPTVVEWYGQPIVAFERDSLQLGQKVVVANRVAEGVYVEHVVATSGSDQPLKIRLHAEQGRLWADWRHANGTYAWVEFDRESWGTVTTLPWTDDSWAGDEEVRLLVRSQVLAN